MADHMIRARVFLESMGKVLPIVLVIGLLVGCASRQINSEDVPSVEVDQSQPLRAGDSIRVTFSREPDLSGSYSVDETGHVALPLLGSRKVTGIPASTLRQQLQKGFEQQLRNQAIQISLLRRVRVLGAVNEPGLYHVDPTMSLGDVVALAGGTTTTGNLEKVRIRRDDQEIQANVNSPIRHRIYSGDQIIVPERSWFVRNSAFIIGAAIGVAGVLTRL